LARQTFLTEAVPISMRARALSTLGGTMRVGLFIGPFAGAGAMHFMGLDGAYWAAIAGMLGAGLLSFTVPELEHVARGKKASTPDQRVAVVLRTPARTYLTLGLACSLVAALRACRQIIVPLWATHIGLDATMTSI